MGEEEKVEEESPKLERDFVGEKPVGIEIQGRTFKIKELEGEEADKVSSEYIMLNKDGNLVADLAKRNKLWLGIAVVDAPYKKGEKEFKDLKQEEKSELLERLKPKLRVPLIQAISDINAVGSEVAKNYKRQL